MSKPFKLFIATVVIVLAGLILTIISSLYTVESTSSTIFPANGIQNTVCIGSNLKNTIQDCSSLGSVISESGFPLQYYSSNQQNFISYLKNNVESYSQFSSKEFAIDWLAWSFCTALVVGILVKSRKR